MMLGTDFFKCSKYSPGQERLCAVFILQMAVCESMWGIYVENGRDGEDPRLKCVSLPKIKERCCIAAWLQGKKMMIPVPSHRLHH